MRSKTVDENYKRLRAELDELLSKDKRLTAIADKIAKGAADFSDTARYTQIVSKHMSDVIKHNIGELKQPMAKEMVCKELLRDHYDLINGVFGEVQVSIDEKLGIHLQPVKPAYPAERVDKWAHSLEDPTVEQSVIERRAASGSENIGNSIHDDCIDVNAELRDQAGLDCYLTRDAGGGCCPWCQALEGRYEYASAPDDIFRRHDNCTCTVTYECGRMRQDVWSKKTWEADPKDVEARIEASEAAKPTVKTPAEAQAINEQSKNSVTVLSEEQAEALNEQNKPTVLTEAEAKEREAKALGKDDNVNIEFVDNQDKTVYDEYEHNKQTIQKTLHEVEDSRTSLNYEVGTIVDRQGNVVEEIGGEAHRVAVDRNMEDMIFTHNHPSGGCFSDGDLYGMLNDKLLELRASTPQGTYYSLLRTSKSTFDTAFADEYKEAISYKNAVKAVTEDLKNGTITKEDVKSRGFNLYVEYMSKAGEAYLTKNAERFGYIFSKGVI